MRHRSFVMLCFVFAIGLSVAVAPADAGEKKSSADVSMESTGVKARGAAADENIKTDEVVNSAESPATAPPGKGGAKTRGVGPCTVRVDNWTPWYIHIYVNGNLDGTVAPWGDISGPYTQGVLVLYGVAPFDDGSQMRWGPQKFVCQGGHSIKWKLN